MEWFARHTDWLYRETNKLSDNSIYKEQFQIIGETLVSSGNIIVHKSKTEYYPILIVYPEATPYIPPAIYILTKEIAEEDVSAYSMLSPEEIRGRVSDIVRFINRRHQNADGSVCFVEIGDLHRENSDIYSIDDIIKRLRIWLSGKIPKDSIEVELFHHFPNRTDEIQYLLPDLFFDKEIIKGEFYAGRPSFILANVFQDNKKTYMGVMIYGESQNGITHPPKTYVNDKLILFTQIPDVSRLVLDGNNQEISNKISNGDLIKGYWWQVNEEPQPFQDLRTLARLIGNGDEVSGFDVLINAMEQPLKQLDDAIHIGIRFPGRRRLYDWQMFRLNKGNRSPLIKSGSDELNDRLLNYSIQAVYQEYLTDDYFHMRNKGRAERSALKDSIISIIGCGALGSETADALCKAGVGRILLVDKEEMRAHNAVRHSLGINRVSMPKSMGMAEHLILHNPFINVEWNSESILLLKIDSYLPHGAIGISTIADDNVEAYLNEQAIGRERTVFYSRALRGGKVARIFRVVPQRDACKACLGLYLMDENPIFQDIPEDESLPVITNECNNPVRPASAADMKIIAGILSHIIIEYLQGKDTEYNQWIWSSEPLQGLQYDSSMYGFIRASTLPPHPKCFVCQMLEETKVYILKDVLDLMRHESAESGDVETGGVLIGYRKDGDKYVIMRASKPGPNAKRTNALFEKDEEYCQNQLVRAYEELGENGLYLGEWHYHSSGGNEPSGLDIKSLKAIAAQDNYRITKPIMIILSPEFECAITIHDMNGNCVRIKMDIVEDVNTNI